MKGSRNYPNKSWNSSFQKMNDAIYTVYTGNNVGLTSKVISFYFKDGATIADAVM